MCGIIVDMTIINILIRNYFPKLIPLFDNKNENYGDYIGNNFINVNLINLFTNNYIDKNTSLLIWDLLFIDGNIILIKTFLAIYHYLLPFILDSEQNIETFQYIIKNNMSKLSCDNKNLIFYLIIKEYNFAEEEINQARFSLSVNTANSINKEKEKMKIVRKNSEKKEIKCNLDWPVCIYDQTYNNSDAKFYLVLQKKKKKIINNYFISKFSKENINENIEVKNDEDILIERKVHYCIDKEKIKEKEENEENEDINKEEEDNYNKYNKIINKPEFIEASKNVINDFKIKLKEKEKNDNK